MASCHGCAESFGFWKREVGCPKCGFSYCQKCIRFKMELKHDDELASKAKGNTLVVCQKCYLEAQKSLQDDEGTQESIQKEHVGKAMEVLEMLDDPGKPPITLYRESNRVAALKRGLSIEDQKIVDRLEELRGGRRRKSEQGAEDVAARLAKLKDQPYNPASSSSSSILITAKPETEEDLVARLADQVNLEKKHEGTVVDDIEERLRKLKAASSCSSEGQGSGTQNSPVKHVGAQYSDEPKSEEEQINEIIQRYVAEAVLPKEESVPKDSQSDNEDAVIVDSDQDDDDVDFDHCCRICEEKRATLLCRECDDDIFCSKCFKEFHEELGESHNPTKIKTPSRDD